MRTWLRPGGRVLNLQPLPVPLPLELRAGGRATPLGQAFDAAEFQEDKRAARRAIDAAAAAGLFALRNELPLELELHYETAEDWAEFLVRPKTGGLEGDPVRLAQAVMALARGEGVIVATETLTAALYERTGGP